jgi:hypothetical protein
MPPVAPDFAVTGHFSVQLPDQLHEPVASRQLEAEADGVFQKLWCSVEQLHIA